MRFDREPLILRTDAAHGGRWTSLRAGSREWLWTNPDRSVAAARPRVGPGAAFVDAGGAEECFPTVRGEPDHGDAWTRAWSTDGGDTDVGHTGGTHTSGTIASVEVPGVGRLTRRIESTDQALRLDYTVAGAPGTAFLHAVHALLDVGPGARLEAPGVAEAIVLDEPAPVRPWPSGLDRLGPDDGTAVCALLPRCRRVTVVDGDHALRWEWDAPDQPDACSLLLWRNLRGWPTGRPYRSIGIEPMVGRAAELDRAEPDQVVRLDPSGGFSWTLRLTALCRSERGRTAPTSAPSQEREEALR